MTKAKQHGRKVLTSGRDLLQKTTDGEDIKKPSESVEQPSQEAFAEVCTPDISTDTFKIADKTFKIKISSIKVQKIMAHSLDAVTKLLATIDVRAIFTKFKSAMDSDSDDQYLDMVELIQEIFRLGGLSSIAIMILDLYVGVILAICQSQDSTVTTDWVEDNLMGLTQAQEIFFCQMEKDKMGGRVIDFLAVATRLLVGSGSDYRNT